MPFDLAPLWAGGEKGFQWDFFDLSGLRQGAGYATGDPGPTASGSLVVGVADVSAKTVVEGPDLLTGVMGSTAGGFTYSAGTRTITRSGAATAAGQGISLNLVGVPSAALTYVARFTVSGFSGDPILFRVGGTTARYTITGDGTYEVLCQANNVSANIAFVSSAAAAGTATIVVGSLRTTTRTVGVQTTPASQPMLVRKPKVLRNLADASAMTGVTTGSTPTAAAGTGSWLTNSGTVSVVSVTPLAGDPTYGWMGGNKVRLAATAGRLIHRGGSAGVPLRAGTSILLSGYVDVHSGSIAPRDALLWSGSLAGSTIVYKVDGVVVAGSTAMTPGPHFVECIATASTTPGSYLPAWGIGGSGTVTGEISIWGVQAELGSVRTAYQRTTGFANASTTAGTGDVFEPVQSGSNPDAPGQEHFFGLRFDGSNDGLAVAWPEASPVVTLIVAGREGTWVETLTDVPAGLTSAPSTGAALNLFLTSQVAGLALALMPLVGVVAINRSLTTAERDRVIRYYGDRGAKGLLVADPTELIVNGTFDADVAGWSTTNATLAWDAGRGLVTSTSTSQFMARQTLTTLEPDAIYLAALDANNLGNVFVSTATTGTATANGVQRPATAVMDRVYAAFQAPPNGTMSVRANRSSTISVGVQFNVDNASLRLLVPANLPSPPGESSAIDGTASGSLGVAGSAAAVVGTAGTAAGTLGLTGAAACAVGVRGAAMGTLALSGAAQGALPVSGAASGSVGLAGLAQGAVGVMGAGAGTFPLSGSASSNAAANSGAAAGSLALGASAQAGVSIQGAAAGWLSLAAAAQGLVAVQGGAAGALGLTGNSATSLGVRGASAAVFDLVGSGQGKVSVVGSSQGMLALGGTAGNGSARPRPLVVGSWRTLFGGAAWRSFAANGAWTRRTGTGRFQ